MSTYLDYNATAPIRPQVWQAMDEAREWWCNPSAIHHLGRFARGHIEKARRQIANLLNAPVKGIIFTSGGSEANNMVLKGLQFHVKSVILSAVEHESVRKVIPHEVVSVDEQGCVQLRHLDELLQRLPKPALVSIMVANNETGVLQSLPEIVALVRQHGAYLHTDAVQALGKMPIDFAAWGVDFMTISGHKIGGPVGVGALIMRSDMELAPLIQGGGQERGFRSGTENMLGIVGFAKAISCIAADEQAHCTVLRDKLETRVRELVPDAVIFGQGAPRLSNTTCLAVPGAPFEKQLMLLDLEGICVSAGSSCSSGKLVSSHVLLAMGVDPSIVQCAIRVSLGWRTTDSDIERFCEVWSHIVRPEKVSADQNNFEQFAKKSRVEVGNI